MNQPMGSAFALVLHTHLPMVLNHGRWPHGSDWLCEAAFECYLPLLETAHRLVADGISPKWTINLSPILTEQLASPEFQKELSFYYENVRRACVESRAHFEGAGTAGAPRGPRRRGGTVAASGGSGPASRNCSPGTGSSTSWRTRPSSRPAIPSFSTATSCRSRRDATSPPRRCLGPRRARPTRRIGSRRAAAAGRRSRSSATRKPHFRPGAGRSAYRGTTRPFSSTHRN